MNKHIALGIVAAIVVQGVLLVGFDFAGSQNSIAASLWFLALQSSVSSLLSIAVGSYIARSGFSPSAIAIWLVEWLAIIYIVVLIDDGRHTYLATASYVVKLNWLAISLTLLFTIIGVKFGYLARAKFSATSATI